MKRLLAGALVLSMAVGLAGCGASSEKGKGENAAKESNTLVYGSNDYTRINPAMDEQGEINILLFNGLTAHDGNNEVVPGLAKSWEFDESTYTYTFHLEEGVKWHDGEDFTADDVKFTIESIMDPDNGSENAPNYEDVQEINVVDDHTITFKLDAPNVAFLDYMTMAILPKHLLEGEDMQESEFFRHPIGTGPYKLDSWDEGQAITLVKNEDYFKGAPNIDKIIFKIVTDDNAKAMQMKSGDLDLALLTPKDAKEFAASINMKNDAKVISPEEYWDKLSDIQYYMDEPVADPAAIALYFLSAEASKKVKVVLSGEGSDELFGGYNIYCEPLEHTSFNKIPMPVRRFLGAFAERCLPRGMKGRGFLMRHGKTLEERYFANATNIFTEREANRILKKGCKPGIQKVTKPLYARVKGKDPVTKMQYVDLHLWLGHDILMKGDKMGMANSL